MFFDDLFLDAAAPPTAVSFRSLSASRTATGALIRWRTGSESRTLGFHVYRQVGSTRVRVSSRLIAASARGSYAFVDRKAPRGKSLHYWIQSVGLDGSRRWHGPARVGRS